MLRLIVLSVALAVSIPAIGQEAVTTAAPAEILHVLKIPAALPAGPATSVRVSFYREAAGGEAIWSEVEQVAPDASGKAVLLIGLATEGGIPQSVFNGAEARYIGTAIGEGPEQPRTLLAPSAYALKAQDAETLGGHPASDFALAGVKPRPDTGTNVTQINTSSGILGGGTGPTVSLTADPTYFNTYYGQLAAANAFTASNSFSKPIVSTVATGTAPFTIASTTAVPNLDASLLGGAAAAAFPQLALQNTFTNNEIFGPSLVATTATGHSSFFLWLNASVYNSTKAAAQNIGFQFRAEPLNNDTASPNANLALLSTVTSATPQETGFKITANGIVTFVAAQTFPGTASTTAANTFTGNQTVNGTDTISGAAAEGNNAGNYTGQLSVNDSNSTNGVAVAANSSYIGILGSGIVYGVEGIGTSADDSSSNSGTGVGVFGQGGVGVYGETLYSGSDEQGVGVFGVVTGSYSGTGQAPAGLEGVDDASTGYGVIGVGPSGGVSGSSSVAGATGVQGYALSSTGYGVTGNGGADGVYGTTVGNGGSAGVYGTSSASSAVNGMAGIGVYGSVSGVGTYAVLGVNSGSSGAAVAGTYSGSGTGGVGVSGATSAPSGVGVYGTVDSASGNGQQEGVEGYVGLSTFTGDGVYGFVATANAYGVRGVAGGRSTSGQTYTNDSFGTAIWADSNLPGSGDSYGALLATEDNNTAGTFTNNSNSYTTLLVSNLGDGGKGDAVQVMTAAGHDGACGMNSAGDVHCTGEVTSIVPVANSSQQVEMYSVQSAENWFEDAGSGKLENGAVHVSIESQFAKIVNTGVDYHVFLTPQGECEGLYIAGKTADGFDVRELHHGTSSIAFDYRIMAKRTGHEGKRMADATATLHQLTDKRDELAARRAAHPAQARTDEAAIRLPMPPAQPVPAMHVPVAQGHRLKAPTLPGQIASAHK